MVDNSPDWKKDTPSLNKMNLLTYDIQIDIPLREARNILQKYSDGEIKQMATELKEHLLDESGLSKKIKNPKNRAEMMISSHEAGQILNLFITLQPKFKNISFKELLAVIILDAAFNGRSSEVVNCGYMLMMVEGIISKEEKDSIYLPLISEHRKFLTEQKKRRSKGGKETARIKRDEAADDYLIINRYATDYLSQNRHKRCIASLISDRTSFSKKKIYAALKIHDSGLWQ